MAGVLNGTTIGGSIVQMKVGGDTVNMNKSRVATGEMRVSYRMLRLIAAVSIFATIAVLCWRCHHQHRT
jgi:hypothetical protein